jgi:WD domain, G-beta repeat
MMAARAPEASDPSDSAPESPSVSLPSPPPPPPFLLGRKGGAETARGEPAQKKRRTAADSADSAAAEADKREGKEQRPQIAVEETLPPGFRHLGHVMEMRAACLMFCYERAHVDFLANGGVPLTLLPPEVVELVGRDLVAGNTLVRFGDPQKLKSAVTLPIIGKARIFDLVCLSFPDGRQFIAAAQGDLVQLWDLALQDRVASRNGPSVVSLSGHRSFVTCLASYSDTNGAPFLASGSVDSTILLWDVEHRIQVARFTLHEQPVWAMVVFSDSAGQPCLASGSSDKTIRLWDLRTATPIATLRNQYSILSLCVVRDAGTDFLATGATDTDQFVCGT